MALTCHTSRWLVSISMNQVKPLRLFAPARSSSFLSSPIGVPCQRPLLALISNLWSTLCGTYAGAAETQDRRM